MANLNRLGKKLDAIAENTTPTKIEVVPIGEQRSWEGTGITASTWMAGAYAVSGRTLRPTGEDYYHILSMMFAVDVPGATTCELLAVVSADGETTGQDTATIERSYWAFASTVVPASNQYFMQLQPNASYSTLATGATTTFVTSPTPSFYITQSRPLRLYATPNASVICFKVIYERVRT